jgi:hypothetical protein
VFDTKVSFHLLLKSFKHCQFRNINSNVDKFDV